MATHSGRINPLEVIDCTMLKSSASVATEDLLVLLEGVKSPYFLEIGKLGVGVAFAETTTIENREDFETGEKSIVLQGVELLNCDTANSVEVVLPVRSRPGFRATMAARLYGDKPKAQLHGEAHVFLRPKPTNHLTIVR